MPTVDETLAERGKRYGDFTDHARTTQALKKVVSDALYNNDRVLAPVQQEALSMIFHKIGRIVEGDPNYADSWHDIAGYATLVEQRLAPDVVYVDAYKLTPPQEVPPDGRSQYDPDTD